MSGCHCRIPDAASQSERQNQPGKDGPLPLRQANRHYRLNGGARNCHQEGRLARTRQSSLGWYESCNFFGRNAKNEFYK